jgi:hypothetical protein
VILLHFGGLSCQEEIERNWWFEGINYNIPFIETQLGWEL